jgi:DNA-binding NarL/FixJ family response regulator
MKQTTKPGGGTDAGQRPEPTSALLAARSDRMRTSLQAVLAASPRIGAVDEADDGAAALHRVARQRPALLVLDTNLPDGRVWEVLKQVRGGPTLTRCVIMAENMRQLEMAKAAGADGVLIKGFSTAALYLMIDELLARRAESQVGGAEAGQELAPGEPATPAAGSAGVLDGGTG